MPTNAIAKELASLGASDFHLMSRQTALLIKLNDVHSALEANRKARCELLTTAAQEHGHLAGLTTATTETVIAPKDPGE